MAAVVIQIPADIPAAVRGAATLLKAHAPDMPDAEFYALVGTFYGSAPDQLVTGAEALYSIVKGSAAGPLQTDCAQACGSLTAFVVARQWHALGQSSRGVEVMNACRRILGDDTITQLEADDPAPLTFS